LVGSLGLSCWYKRFCSALATLVGPVQNTYFLTVHYFNSFVPIAQQAGQAAVLGCLSLSMCLWEQAPGLMLISLQFFLPHSHNLLVMDLKQHNISSQVFSIQHCTIYRSSDSTVSEDAGIEPSTFATLTL
jgi:hypothetical protein